MSIRRRHKQSPARKSLSAAPSVVGDKVRAAAMVYESDGQHERADAMRQAASIVDKHYTGSVQDLLDFALMRVDEAIASLQGIRRQVMTALKEDGSVAAPPMTAAAPTPAPATHAPAPKPHRETAAKHAPAPPSGNGKPALTPCEAAILRTLKARGSGMSKAQVAVMTHYRVKSGSFNAAFTDLKEAGYIDVDRWGLYIATESGSAFIGDVPKLPTGREAIDFWRRKLGPCAGAILQVMFEDYPNPVDKEDLAERAGLIAKGQPYSSGSGSFNKALTDLRKIELVDNYCLSPVLMETAGS